MALDHFHRFQGDPTPWELPDGEREVLIGCLEEDCYTSINREMYPPEKIGPKLYFPGDR